MIAIKKEIQGMNDSDLEFPFENPSHPIVLIVVLYTKLSYGELTMNTS